MLIIAALGAATMVGCSTAPAGPPPNQVPLAIFHPSSSTGTAPLSVDVDASDSSDPDGSIVAWNWDFGGFATGSGQTVSHTFPAGTHTVTLTVTDNGGATSSSTTVISSLGPPPAPTGLHKTGSGCCNTYGDFAWDPVPGATLYLIEMDGYAGGGCVTDHSATIPGPASTGRVQAFGLCLGSHYDVRIRAQANGMWGDWSSSINIVL
jgi:hypothetical protein